MKSTRVCLLKIILIRQASVFWISVFLSACGNMPLAPVSDLSIRSQEYPVSKPLPLNGRHIIRGGETLFSIAWRYGIDYKKIANLNNIHSPFRIFPGQVLLLDKKSIEQSKSISKAAKNPKNPSSSRKSRAR